MWGKYILLVNKIYPYLNIVIISNFVINDKYVFHAIKQRITQELCVMERSDGHFCDRHIGFSEKMAYIIHVKRVTISCTVILYLSILLHVLEFRIQVLRSSCNVLSL
jgi:hypothetical protein